MRYLVLFAALALPAVVEAQQPMRGPNGEPGVWLPEDVARDALEVYTNADEAEERERLLEARVDAALRAASLSREAAEVAAEAEAVQRAATARAREERDCYATRARRRFWAAVGSGLGALVTGLLVGLTSGT